MPPFPPACYSYTWECKVKQEIPIVKSCGPYEPHGGGWACGWIVHTEISHITFPEGSWEEI